MFRANEVETHDGFFHYGPNGEESSFASIDNISEKSRVESDSRTVLSNISF
jgi:hypothetical protein